MGRLARYAPGVRAAAVFGLLLVSAALVAGSALASAENDLRAPRATLLPTSLQPLKLRGTRFVPRERIRVTVSSSHGTMSAKLSARTDGTFVVSFPGFDLCNGVSAAASGDRGSRASFQLSSSLVCD